MKIVVVDDDERIRELLRDFLESKGHEVECAPDGAGALTAVRTAPPAVMILDLMMPGMSGLEVLRSLAAAGEVVPTIVLTAANEDEIGKAALDAGARAFLATPIDLAALEQAVQDAAGGSGKRAGSS